ncbi:hypothetical protein LINPERHAP2_LOCUS14049 [Linum perenne]
MANLAGKRRKYNLADLPLDLHLKIVSLIASVSITDLFNVTQTCKSLYKAGSHPFVLQNAAVWSRFYAIHARRLRNKESAEIDGAAGSFARFVKQCLNSGNPEAMLCCQTEEYFFRDYKLCRMEDEKKKEEAIRCLKTADAKGQVAAKMVFGVIYLIAGGRQKDAEFDQLVRSLFGMKAEDHIRGECRTAGKFMEDCIRARSLRVKKDALFRKFISCTQERWVGLYHARFRWCFRSDSWTTRIDPWGRPAIQR